MRFGRLAWLLMLPLAAVLGLFLVSLGALVWSAFARADGVP